MPTPQERLGPGASRPRTAQGAACRPGRTPHRLRPCRLSSPQPHGHQLSTYLLSESGSWPGTPSAEPQGRFLSSEDPRQRLHRVPAPQDPDGARALCSRHTSQCSCTLRREPLRKAQGCTGLAGTGRGGERQGSCSWRPRAPEGTPDAGQPPHSHPGWQGRPPCTKHLKHSGHLENHAERMTAAPAQ